MSVIQSQDPFRNSSRFQSEIQRFHEQTFELSLDIDTEVFFARPEQGWSVAENYTHISKVCHTMRLVFSPLHNPATWVLGRAPEERPELKEMLKDYHAGLEKGFRSGPFTPAREEVSNPEAAALRKATILDKWKDSWKLIAENVQNYSDQDLITKQFYHPILGRIPLIEAAYMAIFHSMHHLKKAEPKAGIKLLPPSFLD